MRYLKWHDINDLSLDEGIPLINKAVRLACVFDDSIRIMEKFLNHEVFQRRITQQEMDDYLYQFGYVIEDIPKVKRISMDNMV